MGRSKTRKHDCSLCLEPNEEDLLLLTRLVFTTAPALCIWGETGRAAMKIVAKLTNFRKLVAEVLGATHPDIDACSHARLSDIVPSFLAKFSISRKQAAPLANLADLNKAFKAKWIEVINTKSSLYEIESKIAELHQAMLHKQIEKHKEEIPNNKSESLLAKRPPESGSVDGSNEEIHLSKKKSRFSKEASKILRQWFLENVKNPYPDYKTKIYLSKVTALSMAQIQNWFINARKRHPTEGDSKETEVNDSQAEMLEPQSDHHQASKVRARMPAKGGTPLMAEKKLGQASLRSFPGLMEADVEEGSSLADFKNLMTHPKHRYDDVDISEAIVLDDISGLPDQANHGRTPNFYNLYLNRAMSLLNQQGYARNSELTILPKASYPKPRDQNAENK